MERPAYVPLTNAFLAAVGSEAAMTFLALAADDYGRDCGPLGFSELSLEDLAVARGRPARTVQRHLNALRRQGAIESRRRPNQATRTYLHYGVVGLPELGPLREHLEDPEDAKSGVTGTASETSPDSVTPEMTSPDTSKVACSNSKTLSLVEDREREIEIGHAKSGGSGHATTGVTAVSPIAEAVQSSLQVSPDSIRWLLTFSQSELDKLRAAFPAADIDSRWRQWIRWVAAEPAGRMPKDKYGAFYGWLKRSLDAGSGKRISTVLGISKRPDPGEQAQRDFDRWRERLLNGTDGTDAGPSYDDLIAKRTASIRKEEKWQKRQAR